MRTLLDAVVRRRSRAPQARPRHFSLVDFGADTIKAVVIQRESTGARVLGYGFAPANGRDLSGGRADTAALAAIADEALTAAEDQTETTGQGKVVPDDVLFCIPARLSRGECFTVRQARPDPSVPITARELKAAWERVERLTREQLPTRGDDNLTWKPLAITPGAGCVDNHYVTDPLGMKGRELALSAFGMAVWPSALRAVEAIADRLELALVNVVPVPQALASSAPGRDAILINIGAKGTSLSLIRHDALLATHWWPQGGEFFTQGLARAYDCPPDEAEALKRAYTDRALSAHDENLVAHSLAASVEGWLEALTAALRQMAAAQTAFDRDEALPEHIYLTGGGSLLPDLTYALLSLASAPTLSFRRSPEVESLGRRLGSPSPVLLDIPPHPVSDLLAPAISLATCLE
jgi:cell division ATPase FtsA